MEMPKEVYDYLLQRQKENQGDCAACNSFCCKGAGFAILENVQNIYDAYKSGKLKRKDYHFKEGLSFRQFVFEYFDWTVILSCNLMIFFPKMLAEDDRVIHVPPWNYWEAREYIKRRETSCGCIFLNKRQTKRVRKNYCILHDEDMTKLGLKPVDCRFLNCSDTKVVNKPTKEESLNWFDMLARHFPNSKERFSELCPGLK